MGKWRDMELCLQSLIKVETEMALHRKIWIVSGTTLLLSLLEHMLSVLTTVKFVELCAKTDNVFFELFYQQFKPLFMALDFPGEFIVKSIFGRFCLTVSTFLWTYMDLFVILISIGLSSKFKEFNHSLVLVKNHNLSENFWEQKRAQYRILCDLCEYIDNIISTLTLIAFSNDIFFICVQLLNSLKWVRSTRIWRIPIN